MRDYSLFALCALALAACSSTELVPGTAQVKVVAETPKACEFVGEVEGLYHGGSMAGGTQLDKMAAAHLDLKQQTAALSADTVAITKNAGEYLAGNAYRCDSREPASK